MAEVDKIIDKFNLAKDARDSYEDKWDRFYKIYRSYVDETKYKERQSKLFVPFTFTVIEAIHSRMMNWLFSVEPVVTILPMGEEDVKKAEVLDKLIQYQLRLMRFFQIADAWLKECLIYGSSVLKVRWNPQKGMPEVIHIDLRDFYVDPKADHMNYKWCFHRTIRDIDYLREMEKAGIYQNIDEVATGTDVETAKKERLDLIGEGATEYTAEELEKAVELLEYWEDDRVVTIANRAVIIREAKNPFYHGKKPFVHIINNVVPHEFYGLGEVEPLERLQHELNAKRNQRLDAVNLILNPIFKLIRGKGVNIDDVQNMQPGSIVRMNEPDGLQPLLVPDVKTSAYNEEEMVKRDMQDVSGMYDYARGATPARRETATAITSLQEMANMRFQKRLRLIIEMGIIRLTEMLVALNQQYMTTTKVIPIVGRGEGINFMRVTPQEIQGQFDYIPKTPLASPEIAKGVERRQLIELLGVLTNVKPLLPELELREVIIKIIEAFGWKDIEKIIPPQKRLPQAQGPGGYFQPGQAPIPGGMPPMREATQMEPGAREKRIMGTLAP